MFFDKIVVVDDDYRTRDSLQLVLQKEYKVMCFDSGEAALEYIRKPNNVSLVLVDVFMKGIDGIALLHAIKTINRDLPVIVMTAFGTRDIVLQALQNKADDFLDKPYNVEELRAKIVKFLRPAAQDAAVSGQPPSRMRYFVEKNIAHVTLKDLAEDVYLSENYIGRLFKQKHECGFRELKLRLKVEKAKEMLRDSDCRVQDIAQTLGYQNPETFMRLFKRRTNMTPMAYRRSQRNPPPAGEQLAPPEAHEPPVGEENRP